MKKLAIYLLLGVLASLAAPAQCPKREFRGAWLHTVFQDQYLRNSSAKNKEYLIRQLDSLAAMGVNAVIFQVRPQADAFYASELEPWSCYLTPDGKAPKPFWDPLEFIIGEAHARGMELHAWLNPYRVTSNTRQIQKLPPSHIYRRHPERFVNYGGKLYFDPALPENREFIGKVVDDIVARYDIDGIHFDDYFYPYPIAGKDFPDSKSYARYGKGMKRADWRRHNVDLLIEDIHRRIAKAKPWVRFGISPFGIYRNKSTDPAGSDTRGLENYDALYADVLLWIRKGWVDYLMPQLYWETDHRSASYLVLVDWWNKATDGSRHIYIGQDVERSVKKSELSRKIALSREADRIQGNCWWPGYSLTRNVAGVADSLSTTLQRIPALVPEYPWLCADTPAAIRRISPGEGRSFSWDSDDPKGTTADIVKYAVYRFESRHDIDCDNAEALVAVTYSKSFQAREPGVYVVTALNRANRESDPSAPIYINE
ncbi:MAG: family 10 glycosylhydrolase [Muribaculaceae bacterium]|nr:family 10 glycosylhydrolase [Muribaculaceae bacterium]